MISINHVLPGEPEGDTSWFYRQNKFEQQEILRHVDFKKKYFPELGDGQFSKLPQHTYPHILPVGNEPRAFYEPIADLILKYFYKNNIALHSEALNLKSSQVACLNFLFPLRENLDLATSTFRQLFSDLNLVTGIEFEFTGPNEATLILGEPENGKRGQNRTSIDAAIFWLDTENQRHASLIEWKYTEHSFGICGAFSNASINEKQKCLALQSSKNLERDCILTSGKRHCSRNYWKLIYQAGIYPEELGQYKGCLFQGPFYQLMRQTLLGYVILQKREADQVEIISMSFNGNTQLLEIPAHLSSVAQSKNETVITLWNQMLKCTKPILHITVEEFLTAVDNSENYDPAWRDYLRERYGV